MRIIKRGTVPVNRITCKTCESILEYVESDIMFDNTDIDDGYYYVVCPVCKKHIKVKREITLGYVEGSPSTITNKGKVRRR